MFPVKNVLHFRYNFREICLEWMFETFRYHLKSTGSFLVVDQMKELDDYIKGGGTEQVGLKKKKKIK